MKAAVCVLATLDSKHEAALFACEQITAAGAKPWVLDLSLRTPPPNDDFPVRILRASTQALSSLPRTEAATLAIAAGAKIVNEKLSAGELHGALGIGGANGATMACGIMRQLPMSFPKIMVTPVAATAAVQWYVAESDIAMYPTIGDIWLNRVTRAALKNAAYAITATAREWSSRGASTTDDRGRPLIGLSSFGNLQPSVDRITHQLEKQGMEVIHFHASGPGGRALEALAGRRELAGVIDLTTSELTDLITGGVYSAGEGRLRAASAAGIPQVVVPGAIDFTNWWADQIPPRFRQREFYRYNSEIMLMRTDAEEMAALGKLFAERLSAAQGPAVVMIPTGGYSQLTGRKTYDIAGAELGSWSRSEIDAVFVTELRRHWPGARIKELPYHINDDSFADACCVELMSLLDR